MTNTVPLIDQATILRIGLDTMRICVPKDWTEEQILAWAKAQEPMTIRDSEFPSWKICRNGCAALAGTEERIVCEASPDHVHHLLQC
jgi:hypothetical protein